MSRDGLGTKIETEAGKRLLWMLDERFDSGSVKAFDAKLVRRIVEDFIPRIEAEAVRSVATEEKA